MAAAAAAAAQRLLAASTKIIGVGRNYVAHAKELGNPVPKEPLLFLKPTSSFLHAGVAGAAIEVPGPVESLHHEVELAVVLSQRARDVPEASAMDFVGGYALALDMTAREFQSAAKVCTSCPGFLWSLLYVYHYCRFIAIYHPRWFQRIDKSSIQINKINSATNCTL
ncbi:hypothetical protein DAI22_03g219650 [Oryza sativa Japonica Group]|nr:probable acylpyruvase FAHD1, mitochondrial [Oryza sativa Japonica Group]KAF2939752.1 hypothetical protein DAI22_03g219650 [Oryza sativa Japonica Group]